MADTAEKTSIAPETLGEYERHLHRDYSEDLKIHDDGIVDFDAFEAMHNGKTYDAISKKTSNGLTDSMTATIYLERAARVAGQLPEGEMQAFGKKDKGKGMFMDILRQKWIYPNANAQRSFKTKMFLWQYGSSEYGYMPMYYDLNVAPNGYFGPDCWLWNPRMFIPQAGFTTVSDMDYCHALVNKSPKFFEDLLEDETDGDDDVVETQGGWKYDNIRKAIDAIKEKTKTADPQRDTVGYRDKAKSPTRQITIATRYEAGESGKWITFLPDFNYIVIREIDNPHKNGRIPFVIKPCIPTFDSFYNIGDFQRSMPMQFANDGLDNFYFQGIKINLFPPTVVAANDIIRHTVSNEPGSVWEVTNNVNSVKRLETSTAGLSTYQSAKGMAKGAIQSIAGTTDTRSNADSAMDPGMGKTPEALKMIQSRESTRDNQDRELLEEAMVELIEGMTSLIPTMKAKIPVDMFSTEIEEIVQAGHTDLLEILKEGKQSGFVKYRISESKTQMRITLDPTKFVGLTYKFQLVPNSTAKKSKEAQLSSMLDFLGFVGKIPNALQEYREVQGKVPNWQQIFAQFGSLADVPGMDKFFMDAPPPPKTDGANHEDPTASDLVSLYKVAPDDIKRQLEIALNLHPSNMPAETTITDPSPAPAPVEDPLVVNGLKFSNPEIAAKARALHNMRNPAVANQ